MYDPFASGDFSVARRALDAVDSLRGRTFPLDVWIPQCAKPANYPLVIYSHSSGGRGRRTATFLCSHLASHGYIVAAMDHSEIVAPELERRSDETNDQKIARIEAIIASRAPDIEFLLDYLLANEALSPELPIDPSRIGIVGHSFGGWTALAATELDWRIRAVVALAPAGSSKPRPGILPVKVSFKWGREVPALYLAAENDVSTPLDGIYELVERAPHPKRLIVLRRADHLHFVDDVEQQHETIRTMAWPAELAWIGQEMRPMSELCSGEHAHLFTRGLTLAHFDAVLAQDNQARQLVGVDLESTLRTRGVDVIVPQT